MFNRDFKNAMLFTPIEAWTTHVFYSVLYSDAEMSAADLSAPSINRTCSFRKYNQSSLRLRRGSSSERSDSLTGSTIPLKEATVQGPVCSSVYVGGKHHSNIHRAHGFPAEHRSERSCSCIFSFHFSTSNFAVFSEPMISPHRESM